MKTMILALALLLAPAAAFTAPAPANTQIEVVHSHGTDYWVVFWVDAQKQPQRKKFFGPTAEADARAFASSIAKK